MRQPKLQFKLFLLLIIIGSSIPGKSVPEIVSLSWDKLLHIIEYSILGALGYRAITNIHISIYTYYVLLESYLDILMNHGRRLFQEDFQAIMMLLRMELV